MAQWNGPARTRVDNGIDRVREQFSDLFATGQTTPRRTLGPFRAASSSPRLALISRELIEFATLSGHHFQPRMVQERIQHFVFGYRELL